jgi:hypothetical protein
MSAVDDAGPLGARLQQRAGYAGDKVRWYQQPEEEGSQDGARP